MINFEQLGGVAFGEIFSSDHEQEAMLCHLTARQLREFALPGAFHRLIVPVVSMD
jgi:hypothetical protein